MSILSSTRPTLGVAIIAALGAVFLSPHDDDERLADAPAESVSPEPDSGAGDDVPRQAANEGGNAGPAPGLVGHVRHLLSARLHRLEVDASR
jgi:hypothetical protein